MKSAAVVNVNSMLIEQKQVHVSTHWLRRHNCDSILLIFNNKTDHYCFCSVCWELVGHRAKQWEDERWGLRELSAKHTMKILPWLTMLLFMPGTDSPTEDFTQLRFFKCYLNWCTKQKSLRKNNNNNKKWGGYRFIRYINLETAWHRMCKGQR